MARNNNKMVKRRSLKIQPAVQKMLFTFDVPSGGAVTDFTLDLSQSASLLNRRFYRQGLNWAVSGIKVLTSAQSGSMTVKKLPATWTMSNSWHKGFAVWQKMNDEALEESESLRPRFLDFKIYADAAHHSVGFGANLLPGVLEPTFVPAVVGEWEASKYQIPDNTLGATGGVREREVVAIGANFPGAGASGFNAVSLIEGYANSRGLPNVLDPNAPADAGDVVGSGQNWIAQLDSDGTQQIDAVIDDMISENNIAPYPFENDGVHVDTHYPGGPNQLNGLEVHDIEFITGTTIGGTTRFKGGLFPCGLVRITAQNDDPSLTMSCLMQIDLVPGIHRGYLAEPMQDM